VGWARDDAELRGRLAVRWGRRNPYAIILGLAAVAVLVVAGLLGVWDTGNEPSHSERAAAACAEQWDRAEAEGVSGSGADTELRRTLVRCPDYATWQREMDRVGGQSPSTLRAACAVEPSSLVCRDARQRGQLN
jgi:hypothetical protein